MYRQTAKRILHRLCTQAAIHDESSEILSHRPHSPLNPPVPSSLHQNGLQINSRRLFSDGRARFDDTVPVNSRFDSTG
jgi:hypothetical protein